MAAIFDPATQRHRSTETGRFISSAEPESGTAATADSQKAILTELRSLKREIKQLNKRTGDDSKQSELSQRDIKKKVKAARDRQEWHELVVGLAMIGGCLILQVLLQPENSIINETLGTDFNAQIKEGDKILTYTVTSGFGDRDAPKEGASTDHQGVDLDAPEGTILYAIGSPGDKVTVECNEQPEGAGTYATMTPKATQDKGLTFRAFHLSECSNGEHMAGAVVARSGNTGNSTGAHLHWEELKDGNAQVPTKGYLIWALTGSKPASPTNNDFEAMKMSIIEQESGGDHTVVNADSGAVGKAQVMPENVSAWGEECLGKAVTVADFKDDPDLQSQIVDCKLGQYWTEAQSVASGDINLAVRMVASAWYSGDPSLYDSTAPQSGYPSIQAYTLQVLEKFKANQGQASDIGTTTVKDNRPPLKRLKDKLNQLINGKTGSSTTATNPSSSSKIQFNIQYKSQVDEKYQQGLSEAIAFLQSKIAGPELNVALDVWIKDEVPETIAAQLSEGFLAAATPDRGVGTSLKKATIVINPPVIEKTGSGNVEDMKWILAHELLHPLGIISAQQGGCLNKTEAPLAQDGSHFDDKQSTDLMQSRYAKGETDLTQTLDVLEACGFKVAR